MKVLLLLFTLSILQINLAACQEKSFILYGTVNIDTGDVKLFMSADSSLYPNSVRHLASRVVNGKFKFESKIPHPMAFYILISNAYYMSDIIVVEPGKQSVECNIDSSREVPKISNRAMREYANYRQSNKDLGKRSDFHFKKYGELQKQYPKGIPEGLNLALDLKTQAIYDEGDRALLTFVGKNPGSYWAFWRLSHLMEFGYEKVYTKTMPLFSDSIKTSYSWPKLSQVLKRSNILAVGNKFPRMKLRQIDGKQSPGISYKENKYTLIDFWYTNCGPCIAGFPSLLKVYNAYHKMGFEVACIATDALKYKDKLPVSIKKYNLTWLNYWDLNGKGASYLSIQAFPTNFLLDANGIIIQKNIRGPELAAFLEKNL